MDVDDPFSYPISNDWSKPFASRVKLAKGAERWREAHLATLEAVIRRLVRRGWLRRRTSTSKRNKRATSRYLRPKGERDYEIRISDHYLHPEQLGSWRVDYIITNRIIREYNVLGIITLIERDYRTHKQGLSKSRRID